MTFQRQSTTASTGGSVPCASQLQSKKKKHLFSTLSHKKQQPPTREADEEDWELNEAELATLDVIENLESDDEILQESHAQWPTASTCQSIDSACEISSPCVLRKRPGVSIYKTSFAPGQASVPDTG